MLQTSTTFSRITLLPALVVLFGLLGFPGPSLLAQDSLSVDLRPEIPLFASQDFLTLRLETDLKALLKDKKDEREYHEGVLIYQVGDEEEVSVPVKLRIRGNFRRSICDFPPIRVKFDSADAAGTIFAGQKKLKLVTHCKGKAIYESYVREEYLLYRAYNQLTPHSFRARFGEITYVDTRGKMDTLVKPTFFIEPEKQMAARCQGKILDVKQVHPNQSNRYQATLMAFYAYMIGNTDWSIPGLHNVRLVTTNPGQPPLCVPYDFDWSGAIMTPYAKPNSQLGLTSVKQRIFRGFCQEESMMRAVADTFLAHREDIVALYKEMPGLPEKRLARVLEYYEGFYAVLEEPKRFKREILNKCRTNR